MAPIAPRSLSAQTAIGQLQVYDHPTVGLSAKLVVPDIVIASGGMIASPLALCSFLERQAEELLGFPVEVVLVKTSSDPRIHAMVVFATLRRKAQATPLPAGRKISFRRGE